MIRNHAGPARRSLAVLLAAAAISAAVSAEDAASPPDDPFAPGAFESGAGLAPDSAPKPKAEYLVGGSALVSADAYFPLAERGYAAISSASGKIFGKVSVPDYGTLYASYAIYQPFLSSLSGSGPAYAAPAVDLDSPTYVLPELYYSFDLGKRLFVRLGKQLLAWGPSRVWSPVDFVNARRADFFAPLDLREGRPGLRLLSPLGPANVILFADSSRSSSASGAGSRDLAETTVLDGRIDAAIGGFELGLSGRAGREVQGEGGFDFSGDVLGCAAYGELALAPAYSGYDGSAKASLGFSRALGDLKRWLVSAEGYYNSEGKDLRGELGAMAADPLYSGAWYAYAALERKQLLSPDLDATISYLENYTDGSYQLRLQCDFSLPKAPPFSLLLSYYGGGEGKELTYYPGDRSLSVSARTRVDF
jgi:hypothetical protein